MGFSVVATKKLGAGKLPEYSRVPDGWVDEHAQKVYFPRNQLIAQMKDEKSVPDVSKWMITDLIKLYNKNLPLTEADVLLDAVIDRTSSDGEPDQKRTRLSLSHSKQLVVQKQYTLSNADGSAETSVSNHPIVSNQFTDAGSGGDAVFDDGYSINVSVTNSFTFLYFIHFFISFISFQSTERVTLDVDINDPSNYDCTTSTILMGRYAGCKLQQSGDVITIHPQPQQQHDHAIFVTEHSNVTEQPQTLTAVPTPPNTIAPNVSSLFGPSFNFERHMTQFWTR